MLLLKSAPNNKSPISGSGVSDFAIRKVVPQYSQEPISCLMFFAGKAAPQLGQFSDFIFSLYGVGVSVGIGVGVSVSVGTGVSVGGIN